MSFNLEFANQPVSLKSAIRETQTVFSFVFFQKSLEAANVLQMMTVVA